MATKSSKIFSFFTISLVVFFVILFLILIYSYFLVDQLTDFNHDLKRDGVCLIKNVISKQEIESLKRLCSAGDYKSVKKRLHSNMALKQELIKNTGAGYVFQDYIWIIQKSSVHTCHRDNNGDFFNKGQKHPSYTFLIYLEDMEKCLGVIPKSHIEKGSYGVNIPNSLKHIICNAGDVILFNANLIHVGSLDKKENNLRIQMKFTHHDDIPHIKYYEDFNKILNEEASVPKEMRRIQKNVSCMFPAITDYTQGENIRSARGSVDGVKVGWGQKMFSYLFYGNADYYDLPNAF